jgi:hypothetical protein
VKEVEAAAGIGKLLIVKGVDDLEIAIQGEEEFCVVKSGRVRGWAGLSPEAWVVERCGASHLLDRQSLRSSP